MNISDAPKGWQQGYHTSVDYTTKYFPALAPEHLNYACLLHGFEPPTLDRRYNYFELGCGHGATVSALAAANPEARFFANDFMPSHIASGQRVAGEVGLSNLTLLEDSFEQLADGSVELPEFDYITMHGVYTWVSPQVRQDIVRFVARKLKPGGILMVAYNALPGWAASTPVQRWLMASTQWSIGSSDTAAARASAWLQRLSDTDAAAFVDSPAMTRRLAQVATADSRYIMHEYMNQGWAPAYHADVAGDFATAKLVFAGSAMLPWFGMSFPPEQQALLRDIPDPIWQETAKDYLTSNSFRMDVFVKGLRPLSQARRSALLDRYSVATHVPAATALECLGRNGSIDLSSMSPVIELLAAGPVRLDGLGSSDPTVADCAQVLLSIASALSMHRCSVFYSEPSAPVNELAATAWNSWVAEEAAAGGQLRVLVSPLVGGGVTTDDIGLAVYRKLSGIEKPSPEALSQLVAEVTGSIDNPDKATVHKRVQEVIDFDWPLWKRLAMA